MRPFKGGTLLLAAALLLGGCVHSKERVTLLDPAESPRAHGSKMGSLVVEYGDGEETPVTMANQQANLRGDRRPRIRQLSERDPFHTEVMNGLPFPIATENFTFASSASELSEAELGKLQQFLSAYILSHCDYYTGKSEEECAASFNPGMEECDPNAQMADTGLPAFHVLIEGYSDSYGVETTSDADLERMNNEYSFARANNVKGQVVALVCRAGIPITSDQIEASGNGHYAALAAHDGQRVSDDNFRIVSVTVR